MILYMARHGETSWNVMGKLQGRSDVPLNENGIRQAHMLSESMKRTSISAVYSSHLLRAAQTGQIVAKSLGIPFECREGMQEMSMGDWEGRTWREVAELWPDLFHDFETKKRTTRPPNGETYLEVFDRFIPAILSIAQEMTGDVLVVTHSACMMSFQAELHRTPMESMLKDYITPNGSAVAFDRDILLDRWKGLK